MYSDTAVEYKYYIIKDDFKIFRNMWIYVLKKFPNSKGAKGLGNINIKRKMQQEKQRKTETEKNCLLRDASSVVRNLARCFYEKY